MNILEKHKILKLLMLINLTLLILHLFNQFFATFSWTISLWFYFGSEANIPTWFSSTQLFALFTLSMIYSTKIEDKRLSRAYILMGFVFLFFSVDETAGIHEGITKIMGKMSIYSPLPDGRGVWMFVYSLILLILVLLFRREMLAFLNEKIGRTIFIVGALIFVSGGVGFEVIGYYLYYLYGNSRAFLHLLEVTFEEGFELLGQSLMIYALLSKIDSIDTLTSQILGNTTDKTSEIIISR